MYKALVLLRIYTANRYNVIRSLFKLELMSIPLSAERYGQVLYSLENAFF